MPTITRKVQFETEEAEKLINAALEKAAEEIIGAPGPDEEWSTQFAEYGRSTAKIIKTPPPKEETPPSAPPAVVEKDMPAGADQVF